MRNCAVQDCTRPYHAIGLCQMHAKRLRKYGNPNFVKRVQVARGTGMAFITRLVATPCGHNECIPWPFGRAATGYGHVSFAGKQHTAHRIICEKVHGPAPLNCEVAHSCGNPSCVNPSHLRWATHIENMADKVIHGTYTVGEEHASSKLSKGDVRYIKDCRRGADRVSNAMLASYFNVSEGAIKKINSGKSWGHVA